MTIEEIKNIIKGDETRVLELKKTTGELKDGMHSACAFLNTDGGWLLFGIAPTSLKIIGQQVNDNTRREIAQALAGIEPMVNVRVEYVPVPEAKADEVVIAMHFNGWVWGDIPYTYHGCPYVKVESTTKVMPRDMYDERLKASKPQLFSWENQKAFGIDIGGLDENRVRRAVITGVESGRLSATAMDAPLDDVLMKLGVLIDGEPTNAAVMLFARETIHYPQLLLRMARFRGTSKDAFIDNQRVKGNFFVLLDAGMAFLFKHLNLSGDIVGLKREEHLEIPVTALREGLINALCHRQYNNPSDSISIAVYDDRVEIVNPGHFTHGLTPATIKHQHGSHPFNPSIADVLYLSTYLESWGSGVKRMIDECVKAGIPEPEYITTDYEVKLVFRKHVPLDVPLNVSLDVPLNVSQNVWSKLTERQCFILDSICKTPNITREEMSLRLNVSTKTISRELDEIRKHITIDYVGQPTQKHWVVNGRKN